MVILSRFEFSILYHALYQRVVKACAAQNKAVPQSYSKIIGYPTQVKKSDGLINIASLIHDDARVNKFLKDSKYIKDSGYNMQSGFSAGDLYNKMLDYAKGASSFSFREVYTQIYFVFLGCANFNEFYAKYAPEPARFRGFYFSNLKQQVQEFELVLEGNYDDEISAKLLRFYDYGSNAVLSGNVEYLNRVLRVNLSDGNFIASILIMTDSVGKPSFDQIKGYKTMHGIMTEVNSHLQLTSQSCIIVNEKESSRSELVAVRRYLNLERGQISRGQTPIDVRIIAHMAGNAYRIVSEARSGELLQSRLQINDDYSATIHHPEMGFLNCQLTVSNYSLLLAILRKGESELSSFASVDIPRPHREEIIRGNFLDVGNRNIKGGFVMIEDNTDFEPVKYTRSERLPANDEIFKRLWEELIRLRDLKMNK